MNPIATDRIHRILVTRTDRIGDLVLSTPVFSELRKKFPKAWIAALTFVENREILIGNPHLDEVILYDKKGSESGFVGNLNFARKLAKMKFDLVIHLHATNRMHWVSRLANIPVRIGWDRKSAWALTHRYPDIKKEGKRHEAEYNFDLLAPLGVSCPAQIETHFPLNNRAAASVEELLKHHRLDSQRPWIVLNPSASCASKMWPAGRFGHLAEKLIKMYDSVVVVIGTTKDRKLVEKMRQTCRLPFFDLTGKLTLGMLGHLLKKSALLISNDSGPVHIASAVGTPVISIFGRKQPGLSPQRWRPLGKESRVIWKDVGCDVCLAHNCQIQFLCLDVITVEEVMSEVEKFEILFNVGAGSSRPSAKGEATSPLHAR